MKNKVITLGATAIMGISTLGIPQLAVHADTTKSGNTVVSYTGTAPKPKDWGISVPSAVDLSTEEGNFAGISHVNYGTGELSIVTAEGSSFEDPSRNRSFSVSGTSQYVAYENMCIPPINQTSDLRTAPWLYASIADQGAVKPTGIPSNASSDPKTIQNITFESKADGNSHSPLTRYITFAANVSNNRNVNYSDKISWTAKELNNS